MAVLVVFVFVVDIVSDVFQRRFVLKSKSQRKDVSLIFLFSSQIILLRYIDEDDDMVMEKGQVTVGEIRRK